VKHTLRCINMRYRTVCPSVLNKQVGKRVGKRPQGGHMRSWDDNIKMDLTVIGFEDVDWINVAQDRDR
jgi:hypothetical protein